MADYRVIIKVLLTKTEGEFPDDEDWMDTIEDNVADYFENHDIDVMDVTFSVTVDDVDVYEDTA